MKTEDLKKELINKIQNTTDDRLLENVLKFFELDKATEFYQLTKEEEKAINMAREDIMLGNFYTQKEVDEKLKKWIEK